MKNVTSMKIILSIFLNLFLHLIFINYFFKISQTLSRVIKYFILLYPLPYDLVENNLETYGNTTSLEIIVVIFADLLYFWVFLILFIDVRFIHVILKLLSLLILFLKYISKMGNVDMTADPIFMTATNHFLEDFKREIPLFNAEDIAFPLYTKNAKIVDSRGRRVKFAGGNWSGAHMCRHCVDGLECRPMLDIAMDIRYKFKMNVIRLTYSLQLFYDSTPVPAKFLTANPELIGKTPMEIFDITIDTLTSVGLMVFLNNHNSSSQWCCSDEDGDGLWWTYQYPQYKFFDCAEAFAKRYSNNPRVIGMDLRNQLRKAHGLAATWGDGNPLTDWHRAATICGQKVLKIAPHWLIFVSGLNYQLDLTGVQKTSIKYSVPNKLVYTGHFYGFSWPIPSWNIVSYQDFKKKLFNSQTFVRGMGHPYFLGQFGNNCKDIPWNYLMKYLKETDLDWTYWALDGFKCHPQTDQTYGVFTNQFETARHPDLLEDMIAVGPPKGTVIQVGKMNLRAQNNVYEKKEYKSKAVFVPQNQQQNPRQVKFTNQLQVNPQKMQVRQVKMVKGGYGNVQQQQQPLFNQPYLNPNPQQQQQPTLNTYRMGNIYLDSNGKPIYR